MQAIVQSYQQHLKNYVIVLISKKQTLLSNRNIDFHIDNGSKIEHVSEVNKAKKVFFTTDNNQIKDNKIEK